MSLIEVDKMTFLKHLVGGLGVDAEERHLYTYPTAAYYLQCNQPARLTVKIIAKGMPWREVCVTNADDTVIFTNRYDRCPW